MAALTCNGTRKLKRPYSADAAVMKLAAAGLPLRDIARELGIWPARVWYIARRLEIDLVKVKPRLGEDTKQAVLDLYRQGMAWSQIAETVGVERTNISHILRKTKTTLRTRDPDYVPVSRIYDYEQIAELHAEGLSDPQIVERVGCSRVTVRKVRAKLGLGPNYDCRRQRINVATLVLALMMLAGGAHEVQAQQSGWQGHPHMTPDPFAQMKTGNDTSCCHSQDCAYTDDCVTAGKNEPGVIGPDGQCHPITEAALKTKNCAAGGTSACFVGGSGHYTMLCYCGSGT